jgi:hypothetical protein
MDCFLHPIRFVDPSFHVCLVFLLAVWLLITLMLMFIFMFGFLFRVVRVFMAVVSVGYQNEIMRMEIRKSVQCSCMSFWTSFMISSSLSLAMSPYSPP